MDLLDIKIKEIKNINLIYLFSTDSIFTKDENKYLGMRVVYNNNNDYMSLDFKDPHFSSLVKYIIKRYNEEKDSRNIVLLGPLTNRLMNDQEIFKVATLTSSFNDTGLSLFTTNKDKLKMFEPYIKEVLEDLLKVVKKYEIVKIDNIDGYNNKYVVNYSIGTVKKDFRMIFSLINNETLKFKIGYIDGINFGIEGYINNNLNIVETNFNNINNSIIGHYIYDVINSSNEKKITLNDETVFYDENVDTITNSDKKLINFYIKLFDLDYQNDFVKTNDNNFISGYSKNLLEDKDNILINNHGIQLFIDKDIVKMKYKIKNGISKYQNRLNVELDYLLYEFTVSKIKIKDKIYPLVEKVVSNNFGSKFDYFIYEIDNIDLKKPFDIENPISIENATSLYDIRNKVKSLKKLGGN